MSNPEVFKGGDENNAETQHAAGEKSAELAKNNSETSGEHLDNQVETAKALHEVKEVFAQEAGKEHRNGGEPTFSGIHKATKSQKKASYRQTMKHVRSELSAPSRTFSKIIHAPVIEKTSDIIGGSFARPNAVLAGSSTALVLVTSIYLLARIFGYRLSGFETIGSFILGWVIGIIYDYVRVMMLGRRS